ncbi:MAG: hypothetical protein ABIM89_10025 [Mycobacteriales bacterium]
MTESNPNFAQARRGGYEPAQVDAHVRALEDQLAAAKRQAADLATRLDATALKAAAYEEQQASGYAGLGGRIEQMLTLAEEEAADVRAKTGAELEQDRHTSDAALAQLRAEADRYAFGRRGDADNEAKKVIEDAKRDADRIRDESERDAAARREEAEAVFESQKAKAAAAASDFETTLAHRRDLAERDFAERTAAAEQQLRSVQEQAEQLRLESQKMRADAERKAARQLEEAERQAREIVADAQARADKVSAESARELAAATQRRDSINSQLSNVRQMLATLGGGSLQSLRGEDERVSESDTTPELVDLLATDAEREGARDDIETDEEFVGENDESVPAQRD